MTVDDMDEPMARTSGESVARRRLRLGLTALVGGPDRSVVEVFPDGSERVVENARGTFRIAPRPQTATEKVLNVVTGPSGAGKSSFCHDQTDWQYRLHNLDDAVRARLGPAHVTDAAARQASWNDMVHEIHRELRNGESPITVDHVFDGQASEDLVIPAREAGYQLRTWVVATDSVELCIARVEQREFEGGHGWPPALVEQIYESALDHASELSVMSDVTHLIDNTGLDGFLPVAQIEDFAPRLRCSQVPEWARERFGLE